MTVPPPFSIYRPVAFFSVARTSVRRFTHSLQIRASVLDFEITDTPCVALFLPQNWHRSFFAKPQSSDREFGSSVHPTHSLQM